MIFYGDVKREYMLYERGVTMVPLACHSNSPIASSRLHLFSHCKEAALPACLPACLPAWLHGTLQKEGVCGTAAYVMSGGV
jgi:hypothetical protein